MIFKPLPPAQVVSVMARSSKVAWIKRQINICIAEHIPKFRPWVEPLQKKTTGLLILMRV